MTEITIPNTKNTSVLINGMQLSGVKLVKTDDEKKLYSAKELLAGETSAFVKEVGYNITLVLGVDSDLNALDKFDLVITTAKYIKSYSQCRILESREIYRACGGYELECLIRAEKKSQIMR